MHACVEVYVLWSEPCMHDRGVPVNLARLTVGALICGSKFGPPGSPTELVMITIITC